MTNSLNIRRVVYSNRLCNIHPDKTFKIPEKIGFRFDRKRKIVSKNSRDWNGTITRIILLVGFISLVSLISLVF